MWSLGGAFGEEEAVFRRGLHHAAATVLEDQRLKIGVRVVAKHGKLEAVLAFGLSVTRGTVTAEPAQDRSDVVDEVGGWLASGSKGARWKRRAGGGGEGQKKAQSCRDEFHL